MASRLDDSRPKQLELTHRQNISRALMNNRNAAGARTFGGDRYEIICDDDLLDVEKEFYKLQVEDDIKKQAGWRGRLRLWLRSWGPEYGRLHPDRSRYFASTNDGTSKDRRRD